MEYQNSENPYSSVAAPSYWMGGRRIPESGQCRGLVVDAEVDDCCFAASTSSQAENFSLFLKLLTHVLEECRMAKMVVSQTL